MDFKKALIATTAVCAVGGLSMAAAETAKAASKPKLGISGYYELFMGEAFNTDLQGSTSSGTPTYGGVGDGTFNIIHYGEIRFKASGKTDGGMKWGVYFEDVQNDAADDGKKVGNDEANLWMSGSWGKVELGGQDGPVDKIYRGAEKLVHHSPGMIDAFANTHGLADEKMSSQDSSDASKITYWTPRISGFQAGYAYIPQLHAKGSVGTTSADTQAHEGVVDYSGKVGPGKLMASWGFGYRTSTNTENTAVGGDLENEFTWRAGVTYAQGPWSIAGGYRHFNNDGDQISNDGDTNAWEVGAAYSGGRWEVAALYYHSKMEDSAGDTKYYHYGLTGAYNLGGGLTVSGSVWHFKVDGGMTSNHVGGPEVVDNTDGTVAILAFGARF